VKNFIRNQFNCDADLTTTLAINKDAISHNCSFYGEGNLIIIGIIKENAIYNLEYKEVIPWLCGK
jgi:stringent starvation protein B